MPASGHLLELGAAEFDIQDLLPLVGAFDDPAETYPTVVADLIFGVTAPPPIVIPFSWLTPPLTFRADTPINDPQVSRSGGGAASAPNAASIAQYGDYGPTITLASSADADPAALATWLSSYYSGFRMRCPAIAVNLMDSRRTQAEIWRILSVRIGDRILIPDAPATWPEGVNTLFVEGISQVASQSQRLVVWNTSPVIGASPGVVGPWFREGISVAGGADAGPF